MPTLFLLGDSTCADKRTESRPETGWGECFHPYLADGWTLDNRAVNGRSTRQFLLEGNFQAVENVLQPGDAVLLQFGHNEPKPEAWRHTEPWTTYQDNLRLMVASIRNHGATPYFVTSIARRRFLPVDGALVLQDTHGDYPVAMQAVAQDLRVPCVDMTSATMRWLSGIGDEASKRFFMNFSAGLYQNYPNGKADDTHLRPEGAAKVAGMIAERLAKLTPKPEFLKS